MKRTIEAKKDNGKYAQCNFCRNVENVYEISGTGGTVSISICIECIKKLNLVTQIKQS